MTDYMGMYNERFMKRAPQYGANARARTYQDYMRNIQNQRMAAGQTFGNLAMQQQNQSFYDRAMGRPPGLSGGMAQQFQNQMSAARSRQLGQTAQQRYQAFSDIAAQEAQASQFARAEAAAEQQFQSQELQFQAQKQAQAQQVMASPNLTFEQKQDQLSNLGFTQGQIERMQPSQGGAIVGGVTSAVAVPTVGLAGSSAYRTSQNIQAFQSAFTGDAGIAVQTKDLQALQDAFTKGTPDASGNIKVKLSGGEQTFNQSKLAEEISKQTQGIADAKNQLVDDLIAGTKGTKGLEKNLDKAKAAFEKVKKSGAIQSDKVYQDAMAAKNAAKDALVKGQANAMKAKAAGIKKQVFLKSVGNKAVAAKAKFAGLATVGKIALWGFGVYMVLEGASMALTGTGLAEGIMNIASGKGDFRTAGKKGLLDL